MVQAFNVAPDEAVAATTANPATLPAFEPFVASRHPDAANPALSPSDVTDRDAGNVADPQLFVDEDGSYYMFCEAYGGGIGNNGIIVYATSNDGLNWTYGGVAFDDGNHTALPAVFKYDDTYYMIPHREDVDGDGQEEIQLLTTSNSDFPEGWSVQRTLYSADQVNDSVPIQWNGTWYILTGGGTNQKLNVLYSDTLESEFSAHPQNPVIGQYGRPCGSPIPFGDRILHFSIQQPTVVYGNAISELSKTDFAWYRWGELGSAGGADWKADKFHNWSATPQLYDEGNDKEWLIAVDGQGSGGWESRIWHTTAAAVFNLDSGGGGGGTQRSILFADGFEAEQLEREGWVVQQGTARTETNNTASGSHHALCFAGGANSDDARVEKGFPSLPVSRVRGMFAHTNPPNPGAYVRVYQGSTRIFSFRIGSDRGDMAIEAFDGEWNTVATGINADQWYQFAAREIDYGAGTYTLNIDGGTTAIAEGLSFENPAQALTEIQIAAGTGGYQARFDDIIVEV